MTGLARNAPHDVFESLRRIEWAFTNAPQAHLVHSLHPYPAKFVPALPREVVRHLSAPGDLILDPFCGCGTALVEALLLGRRAVGSDINPVALVSARAKTTRLGPGQLMRLATLERLLPSAGEELRSSSAEELPEAWMPVRGRRFRGLAFWFDEHVARELLAIRRLIDSEPDEGVRNVALMCFSSIVVAVSHQDSDTRYVRRNKDIGEGDATRLLARRLGTAREALGAFADAVSDSGAVHLCDARLLDYLEPKSVQLVVTSPPYPNAWSYHLYHQNRILWLDDDPWEFKAAEIGHHRAYSAKGGSDAEDFEEDMRQMFAGVAPALAANGHVVVVVGDSIVRGELVRNDGTVARAGAREGFRLAEALNRVIDPRRKAFNPSIGKIRTEHVLIFDAA